MSDTSAEPRRIIPALGPFYDNTRDLSYLIVRLTAGGMLFVHGMQKMIGASIAGFAANSLARRGIDAVVAEAKRTPNITSAVPMIEQPLAATYNGRAEAVLVRGVRMQHIAPVIGNKVVMGSLAGVTPGSGRIAIGSRLAEALGATVGSDISLFSPQGQTTPFGTVPRIVSYKVAAIFEIGLYDYDKQYVFMPIEDAQTLLLLGDNVGMVEIETNNADKVGQILAPLGDKLPPGAVISDWRSMNAQLFQALEVERVAMFTVLSIIILVAVFNILPSLIMLVRAKTRDIAILRTMGATRGGLMRIFMVVGTTIGVQSGVEGRFIINNVPAGTVTLQVRRIGYTPKSVTGVLLEAGKTVEQNISLATAATTLSASVVTASIEKGTVAEATDQQKNAVTVVSAITAEQIAAACAAYVGEIDQMPPMYSALKHEGKALYEYARAGVEIERKPRRVTIHAIDIVDMHPGTVTLDVRCTKGTYIRTLAEEGRTMLLVTHELGFAYHVATRVIFLADGTIHEQGTPDEILKHPKKERTQAFLARHKEFSL